MFVLYGRKEENRGQTWMRSKQTSAKELARLLNISVNTLGNLEREGIVVKAGRGTYMDTASIAAYFENRERNIVRRAEGRGEDAKIKTAMARDKQKLVQMEREFAEGKRVDIDVMTEALEAILVPLKTNLLAVGAKLAPLLVRTKSPTEAMALVNNEIEQCLERVGEELEKLAKAKEA
jgi:phage terminase Nu1 subunit (DNA packaging protein)